MVGALVFGLAVVIVDGAYFFGVDVDLESGGCASFTFQAADFGVDFLVGVVGCWRRTYCVVIWKGGGVGW